MKEIALENFRCYLNHSIKFKPGVNLLIGDNASGKTTILSACKYVLSSYFAGFSDENTKWINPDSNDFNQKITDGILQPERPLKINFTCNSEQFPPFNIEGRYYQPSGNNEAYTLQKNSKKTSRALISGLSEYKYYAALLQKHYFDSDANSQVHPLPLFACFSTEDIHSSRKIDAGKFTKYAQKASFGYYECLEGNGFFNYWIKRLLILQEGGRNLEEVQTVRSAIVDALGVEGCKIIEDISIRPNQKKIYFIFLDGREVDAELLSDGYRRLVNIIMDIAFRSALLNRGIYKTECCKQSVGTVLIDEIDLHLHPTLQTLVIKGLRNAFPKIQFIITTHAPMIMSGVDSNEENIVYKLSYTSSDQYQIREAYTYGMDVSTITEIVLEQPPRDSIIEEKLCMLFDYIDNDDYEHAKILLQELKEKFNDSLPELAKAEAMLVFIKKT